MGLLPLELPVHLRSATAIILRKIGQFHRCAENFMPGSKLDWKANERLALGKGATVQEFSATAADAKFVIDLAPWGEGHLKINGREVAHVDAKDRRRAFRELKMVAERYLEERPIPPGGVRTAARARAHRG